MSINLKLEGRDLKVTAGARGTYFSTEGSLPEKLSVMDSVDLVVYLVQAIPVFSSHAYSEITKDAEEFKTRDIRSQKLKALMAKMATEHFGRELARLTSNEIGLIRRAAEAEIAVAEAVEKLNGES